MISISDNTHKHPYDAPGNENTSFSGNLSPNQVKAYENYFKQVFPKKGQQKLF